MTRQSSLIFANINWILIEKVSKTLLAGVMSVLVARYLGPSNYGQLALALAILGIGTIIGNAGVERVLIKEFERVNRATALGSAMFVRFVAAVSAVVLIVLTARWFYAENQTLLRLLVVMSCALIFNPLLVLESYYRFAMNGKLIAFVRFVGVFGSSLMKLGLIYSDAPLVYFSVPFVVETGLASVLFFYFFKTAEGPASRFSVGKDTVVSLTSQSWPLMASALVGGVYFHLDKIIIEQYVGSSALGVYAFYFSLISMVTYLIQAINLAFLPDLNARFFRDTEDYWARYKQVTAIKVIILLPFLFAFDFVVVPILTSFVGVEYTPPLGLMLVLYCYLILVALGSLTIESYILENKTKLLLMFRVVTLIANLGLNFSLIPWLGSLGAAVTALLCYLLSQFVLPLFFTGYRNAILNSFGALSLLFSQRFYRQSLAHLKMQLQDRARR